MLRRISVLLAIVSLTGCLESVEPERVFRWDGIVQQGEFVFQSAFLWYESQQIIVAAAGLAGDFGDSPDLDPPVRPWRIHSSTCASGGPIVGEDLETWYPNLAVDIDGDARSETAFNAVVDIEGMYHVKLYTSPDDDTVIACIDLSEVAS